MPRLSSSRPCAAVFTTVSITDRELLNLWDQCSASGRKNVSGMPATGVQDMKLLYREQIDFMATQLASGNEDR